jgi:ACS family hexuronate transporter-like MFS transporter
MIAVYMMASFGSIGGGWLSARFLQMGWSVNRSRKITLLICALCVVPVFICARTNNLWLAVALFGLASAAHQGFSANLYTLVSDTCPKRVVSSVIGIGGTGGAVGGMLIAQFTGHILARTNNDYTIPLAVASGIYLFATLCIHLINPRLKPMQGEPR